MIASLQDLETKLQGKLLPIGITWRNLEKIELFQVPEANVALWDHESIGDPPNSSKLHFAVHQKPRINIKEKLLQNAARFLESVKNGETMSKFVGTLKLAEGSSGLGILLNLKLLDAFSECEVVDDVSVPVLISRKTKGNVNWDIKHYVEDLEVIYENCTGLPCMNWKDFFRFRANCSVMGIQCDLKIQLVSLSPIFTVTPLINPLSIIASGLTDFISELKNGPSYTGFVTIDSDKRLLLVPEDCIKLPCLPLVGIWISGVNSVLHPLVWAVCVRYISSSFYEQRLCLPPLPFLIVLYQPGEEYPEFYDCILTNRNLFPEYVLYEGSASTTLPKIPICDSRSICMELKEIDERSSEYESAVQQIEKFEIRPVYSNIVANTDDLRIRKRYNLNSGVTVVDLQDAVPDASSISLDSDSFEAPFITQQPAFLSEQNTSVKVFNPSTNFQLPNSSSQYHANVLDHINLGIREKYNPPLNHKIQTTNAPISTHFVENLQHINSNIVQAPIQPHNIHVPENFSHTHNKIQFDDPRAQLNEKIDQYVENSEFEDPVVINHKAHLGGCFSKYPVPVSNNATAVYPENRQFVSQPSNTSDKHNCQFGDNHNFVNCGYGSQKNQPFTQEIQPQTLHNPQFGYSGDKAFHDSSKNCRKSDLEYSQHYYSEQRAATCHNIHFEYPRFEPAFNSTNQQMIQMNAGLHNQKNPTRPEQRFEQNFMEPDAERHPVHLNSQMNNCSNFPSRNMIYDDPVISVKSSATTTVNPPFRVSPGCSITQTTAQVSASVSSNTHTVNTLPQSATECTKPIKSCLKKAKDGTPSSDLINSNTMCSGVSECHNSTKQSNLKTNPKQNQSGNVLHPNKMSQQSELFPLNKVSQLNKLPQPNAINRLKKNSQPSKVFQPSKLPQPISKTLANPEKQVLLKTKGKISNKVNVNNKVQENIQIGDSNKRVESAQPLNSSSEVPQKSNSEMLQAVGQTECKVLAEEASKVAVAVADDIKEKKVETVNPKQVPSESCLLSKCETKESVVPQRNIGGDNEQVSYVKLLRHMLNQEKVIAELAQQLKEIGVHMSNNVRTVAPNDASNSNAKYIHKTTDNVTLEQNMAGPSTKTVLGTAGIASSTPKSTDGHTFPEISVSDDREYARSCPVVQPESFVMEEQMVTTIVKQTCTVSTMTSFVFMGQVQNGKTSAQINSRNNDNVGHNKRENEYLRKKVFRMNSATHENKMTGHPVEHTTQSMKPVTKKKPPVHHVLESKSHKSTKDPSHPLLPCQSKHKKAITENGDLGTPNPTFARKKQNLVQNGLPDGAMKSRHRKSAKDDVNMVMQPNRFSLPTQNSEYVDEHPKKRYSDSGKCEDRDHLKHIKGKSAKSTKINKHTKENKAKVKKGAVASGVCPRKSKNYAYLEAERDMSDVAKAGKNRCRDDRPCDVSLYGLSPGVLTFETKDFMDRYLLSVNAENSFVAETSHSDSSGELSSDSDCQNFVEHPDSCKLATKQQQPFTNKLLNLIHNKNF